MREVASKEKGRIREEGDIYLDRVLYMDKSYWSRKEREKRERERDINET